MVCRSRARLQGLERECYDRGLAPIHLSRISKVSVEPIAICDSYMSKFNVTEEALFHGLLAQQNTLLRCSEEKGVSRHHRHPSMRYTRAIIRHTTKDQPPSGNEALTMAIKQSSTRFEIPRNSKTSPKRQVSMTPYREDKSESSACVAVLCHAEKGGVGESGRQGKRLRRDRFSFRLIITSLDEENKQGTKTYSFYLNFSIRKPTRRTHDIHPFYSAISAEDEPRSPDG
ncbi:hypothetical protein F4778DRAFT_308026 [Xylariomycetidae sp. FL2044]|nr:hypothetical protein F4778DRAFT_308026 [Xylariomycetidae sp. FL2044]